MATSKKPAGGTKKARKGKATSSKKTAAPPVSFAAQIAPLFRAQDVQCMRPMRVFLINYQYMSNPAGNFANANNVLRMLKPGAQPDRMPMGGPYWSDANIQLFSNWIAGGCQP